MSKPVDMIGQRFGNLVVTSEGRHRTTNRRGWWCLCDCGNVVFSLTFDLTHGKMKSCQCLKSYSQSHKSKIPDRDKLYELYVLRNRTPSQIAVQFGVHNTTVHNWLKRYDIPRRDVKEAFLLSIKQGRRKPLDANYAGMKFREKYNNDESFRDYVKNNIKNANAASHTDKADLKRGDSIRRTCEIRALSTLTPTFLNAIASAGGTVPTKD